MTHSERVNEARRMLEAGEFERAVVSREPADLDYDTVHFECGHRAAWAAAWKTPVKHTCRKCAQAWIEAT